MDGTVIFSPTVANSYVYIGALNSPFYQLNASNVSQQIANFTVSSYSTASSSAVANGYVYLQMTDQFYQLNASNVSQQIASYGISSSSSGPSPAIANGYVYIGNQDYNFYQLNASNISLPNVCFESWSCGNWRSCSGGIQTRSCIDANACETTASKPAESQSCQEFFSSRRSEGGGESSVSKSFIEISPSKPVEMLISTSEMDLTSIVLNVNETITNSSIMIKSKTNNTNLKIGLPTGRIYQTFEVIATGINNTNIVNSTFNFRVNKTWLLENNITIHFKKDSYWLIENGIVGNIKLYRIPGGEADWTPLTTSFSKQDEKYYYFYSTSPGFSTFVIFFNKYDCLPNSARCSGTQVQLCLGNATWLETESCDYKCDNGKCIDGFSKSNQFYFLIILIIGATIIIVLAILRKTSQRKKKKEEKVLEKFSLQKISLLQKIKRNFKKHQKENEEKRILRKARQKRKLEERKEKLKEIKIETKAKVRKIFGLLKSTLQKLNPFQKIKIAFRRYQKKSEEKRILRKAKLHNREIEQRRIRIQEKNKQRRELQERKEELKKIKIEVKAKFREFFGLLNLNLRKFNPIQKIKKKLEKYQRKREERINLRELVRQKKRIEEKQGQIAKRNKQRRRLKKLKETKIETKAKVRKIFGLLKSTLQKLNPFQKIKIAFRRYQKKSEEKRILRKAKLHNREIEQRRIRIQEKNKQRRELQERKEELKKIKIEVKAKFREFFGLLNLNLRKFNPIQKIKKKLEKYQRKREERKMLKKIELQKRKIEQKRMQIQEQRKQIKELKERKKKTNPADFTLDNRNQIKREEIERKYRIEKLKQLKDRMNSNKK